MQQQQQMQMKMKTFEPVSLDSLKVGDQIAIGTETGFKVAQVTDVEKLLYPGQKIGNTYIEEHFGTKVEATSMTPSHSKYSYFEKTILKKDDSK